MLVKLLSNIVYFYYQNNVSSVGGLRSCLAVLSFHCKKVKYRIATVGHAHEIVKLSAKEHNYMKFLAEVSCKA
jgi:hypothetical protein